MGLLFYKLNENKLMMQNFLEVTDVISIFIYQDTYEISQIEYAIFAVTSMPPSVKEITILTG